MLRVHRRRKESQTKRVRDGQTASAPGFPILFKFSHSSPTFSVLIHTIAMNRTEVIIEKIRIISGGSLVGSKIFLNIPIKKVPTDLFIVFFLMYAVI